MTVLPATGSRPKVLMFVLNELVFDSRVLKTANSLSAGYDVLVVGVWLRKADIDEEAARKEWPFRMAWVDLGRFGDLPRNTVGYALRYGKIFREIRKLGLDFEPDIIHAHELSTLPIGRALQRATGAALIYDAHELYRDMANRASRYWRLMAGWEKRLMAKCDAIIACNSDRSRIMHEEYGAPFLPTVIHNMPLRQECVSSSLLQEKTGSLEAGLTRLVLYQGVIMVGRGLESLPRALVDLPPHIGIVLIGGGDEEFKQQLGRLAVELGVQDRFFLLPPVLQTELFPYTCSADAGIVIYQNTCRNNYFCAPNKLYEYCAAGLPMVGADLPPIRAYVEDNEVGTVFDPDDPASLVRAINKVCGDDLVHRRYRKNCLAAASRFNWEARSEVDLLALYASLSEGVRDR